MGGEVGALQTQLAGRSLARSLKVNAFLSLLFAYSLIPELSFILPVVKVVLLLVFTILSFLLYSADLRLSGITTVRYVVSRCSSVRFLFGYLLLGVLSVIWSVDIERSILYSLLTFYAFFAVLFLLASSYWENKNVIVLAKKVVLSIVFAKILAGFLTWTPGTQFIDHFHGVAGFEALTAIILMLCNKVRWSDIPVLMFLILVIGLSTSVKTYFSLLVFFIVVTFLSSSRIQKLIIFIILAGFSAYLLTVFMSFTDTSLLGRLEHGSGRLAIFTFLIERFESASELQKLIGFGYAAGDKFELENMTFYNAHNVLLSALLNLGILGLFLQILVFFSAANHLRKKFVLNERIFVILFGGIAAASTNALANQSTAGPLSGPFLCTLILLTLATWSGANTRPNTSDIRRRTA